MTRWNRSAALVALALLATATLAVAGVGTAAGAASATDGQRCVPGCQAPAQTETPSNESDGTPTWSRRDDMNATPTRVSPTEFRVAVRNAGIARDADVTVPSDVGRIDDGELRGLSVRSQGGADRFDLSVSVAGSIRNLSGNASRRLSRPADLDTQLVYLDASADAQHRAFTVTYSFDVGVDDLVERGAADADAVVLANYGGEWHQIRNVSRVRDGGELVVNATTSGTVPLAFGIRHPNMTVTNVTATDRLLANRTGTVDATVVNRGTRNGRESFAIETRNDTVLRNQSIFVGAGQRRTVQVPVTLPRSGEWPIEIGDAETTVRVDTPRPDLVVSNLSLDSGRIDPGESVSVAATVTNRGTADGAEAVRLRTFDTVVDAERVTLARNESTTVRFSQRFDTAGTYTVAVGNLSRTVTVGDGGTPAAGSSAETETLAAGDGDGGFSGPLEWTVALLGASVVLLFGVAALGRYVRD